MMLTELGAAATGVQVIIGDKLGLYRALAANGGLTSDELAERTGTNERYVREWLANQAASDYVSYDPESGTFGMTAEQSAILADEDSPVYMAGGFYGLESIYHLESSLTDAFRSGEGVGWGDHTDCLFCGTEKFFAPTYRTYLIDDWIPALDGVVETLEAGGKVADVGCGHGVSSILMGEAFPQAEVHGFDFHEPSVVRARELADEAGVDNVSFESADARAFPGGEYDLVTCFDCLHDMGDPVSVAEHVLETLAEAGTWMIVEPMAGDSLEENLNPVGRAFYSFSTSICVPTSLDQDVGMALGAQAGERRLRQVVEAGGFTRFRRATETPFNMILEARP